MIESKLFLCIFVSMLWSRLKSICCCRQKCNRQQNNDDFENQELIDPNSDQNVSEILLGYISDLKAELQAESEIVLIKDGYFIQEFPDTLKLKSDTEIENKAKIKKNQSKIALTSPNYSEAICTIVDVDFSLNILELVLRKGTFLSKEAKEKGRFQAKLRPNFEHLKFIEDGFTAIMKDKNLQNKILLNNEKGICPRVYILRENEDKINETLKNGTTLICTETNADAERITFGLKEIMPDLFDSGMAIRLVTLKNSKMNPDLLPYTKTMAEITDFSMLKIIICTTGVAPKLKSHCNFSNIFIKNAETISELDCWMIIGMLANENTKILLSGQLGCKNKVWGISSLSSIKKEGCISMFERLSKFPHLKVKLAKLGNVENDKTVIEV